MVIIVSLLSKSCSREENLFLCGMSFSFCVMKNFVPLYYFLLVVLFLSIILLFYKLIFILYLCTVALPYAVVLPATLYYVTLYGIVLSMIVICI